MNQIVVAAYRTPIRPNSQLGVDEPPIRRAGEIAMKP